MLPLYAWIVSITESITCLPPMAFCSITRVRCAANFRDTENCHGCCGNELQAKTLYLGNLDAKRDWGHAREYVGACIKFCNTIMAMILSWRRAAPKRALPFELAFARVNRRFLGWRRDEV